ncbi:chitin synthase [Ephemerocybe angulata]|uniref:chitin synthase n=1 Tax=Ephemerocybe angulata TaxID=980116 RepID=A0A8H6HX80_9AGAR|nr:chitin synthase [Tulosesus angulatus]
MSDQRPPRSARPGRQSAGPIPGPYDDQQQYQQGRPPQPPHANVSFQNTEYGDRQGTLNPNVPRARPMASAYHHDVEGGDDRVNRKKSLVRPDREKIDPHHRQFHYRNHVAQLEEESGNRIGVMPSTTGNYPHPQQQQQQRDSLRRGRSLLAREEGDVHESGLNIFRRAQTLRRKKSAAAAAAAAAAPSRPPEAAKKSRGCWKGPGPGGPWMTFCVIVTFWMPGFVLKSCGIRNPEQQRAWREKMGLVTCILTLMAAVGFLTFGFTQAVCGKAADRYHGGAIGPDFIQNGSVVINGYNYDISSFKHPRAGTTFNGSTNPLYVGGWNLAGNDASFLFQKTNQNCYSLVTRAASSSITGNGYNLDWYFPCNVHSQYGSGGANITGYEVSTNCHKGSGTRDRLKTSLPLMGQVYYTWDDVKNPQRNLAVMESAVLDLNLLQWLSRAQVNYPDIFDKMKRADGTFNGKDLTMYFLRTKQKHVGRCLQDLATIGFIDTNTIGCVASDVVLYLSLVFIIGVVAIKFGMAVMFQWFFSWKLGNFPRETYQERMARSAAIEQWTDGIHVAPAQWRPDAEKGSGFKNNRRTLLPNTSRFTPSDGLKAIGGRPMTAYGKLDSRRSTVYAPSSKGGKGTPPDTPSRNSRSTVSLVEGLGTRNAFADTTCPFPLYNVVPQPPPDYEPFNFPLAHTICLVTAYSESIEGLRTTLDSVATTDYPNSHKFILVIADGMVKGDGNDMMTPEIVLSMMKDFVIPPEEVEAHSYVAIADGHKRHNMAKVYAGFYDYDPNTVEGSKQQRVPVVLVAKVGNPLEATEAKPGNRGKRDSQIVLMAFLQKVMFDERMTTFEYEFFNSIWRVTGVSPDRYELVLCVDADTKVFPDSLTRMISCMVCDEEIMGLCGETKIANKAETFVTMMQVFEYYISHHMTKAFESMFGGVTCLPGCFSMYRIKAPKGDKGYWVPILANPDIVEHYSENVVDTLHKKNLLLLGEDRYLTTLMLKTFPKRKNMFCPQAVCKTIVPDTFRVLLSQRRRWINSTVHNLFELVLVRDLCGTFCFSMQFVVGMELAGTLVLPAAISFTLYLIIDSIIKAAHPGGASQNTIPLILLGIVLGLPGLLIVVTSRKIAYVGWMFVYFISLPIWNGVLPAYSFWHFDDFSWGQTRKVAGDTGDDHGDKNGEFDSTHIVMKKWAEFERERLWRKGMQSRDSAYMNDKSAHRYSLVSNSEMMPPTFDSSTMDSSSYTNGPARSRHDSNALLMLPAPLSVNRQPITSTPSVGVSRSSEDAYASDTGSGSAQRLIPSPSTPDHYSESFESHSTSTGAGGSRHLLSPSPYNDIPRTYGSQQRQRAPSPSMDSNNPFRSMTTSPASNEEYQYTGNEEELRRSRLGSGVQLSDSGPVPGPDGVRRVSRPVGRRPTSQASPATNRYSRNSTVFSLPPGAAPPSHHPSGYAS